MGEAESHQVAIGKDELGNTYVATTSGHGVDIWDLTDVALPTLIRSIEIDGIEYGDNTEAVWGVAWQGHHLYVGGTSTGLHVIDVSDVDNAALVTHVPTSEFGGVVAGPVFALGNLLIVTTPKEFAGIATLDISDPVKPSVLDFVLPEVKSYIGAFYGRYVHLLSPFRTYDATTDPSNIELVASDETATSEYASFADGFLFLGELRPNPGVQKIDLTNLGALDVIAKVEGREDFLIDDQFSLPIGNLIVMSDDERTIGSVIAVHDTERDSTPPRVEYVNPKDGATSQALTSRIAVSFSDQVDFNFRRPEHDHRAARGRRPSRRPVGPRADPRLVFTECAARGERHVRDRRARRGRHRSRRQPGRRGVPRGVLDGGRRGGAQLRARAADGRGGGHRRRVRRQPRDRRALPLGLRGRHDDRALGVAGDRATSIPSPGAIPSGSRSTSTA